MAFLEVNFTCGNFPLLSMRNHGHDNKYMRQCVSDNPKVVLLTAHKVIMSKDQNPEHSLELTIYLN